jgi:arabinofuranan 3-O-arabinosyltransferase
MTVATPAPGTGDRAAIPAWLLNACFVLLVVNISAFLAFCVSHSWIHNAQGLGIPTDFVNVWSAGKLALEGHPALAWDWNVQKQIQIAVLGQTYVGNFAWHYPPPFLFIAALLARLPYTVAFMGWLAVSLVPYLAMTRAIVGRPFGWLLAAAFPVVLANTMVGQNGFLTAALIGGTLYLLPTRPILSGICLGLLSYKPQYGLLFPLALIAASQWTVFVTAGIVTAAIAAVSWLAFGIESWQAFFHWMPMFSQAFFTEGRATWFKLQSVFGLTRSFGGSEQLAWALQAAMTGTVVVATLLLWRSKARYSLKAAGLATGTLLITPYLFLYDMMVLAIPLALLVRIGLADGFRKYELPALGLAALLLVIFPVFETPIGLGATLIVAALIACRLPAFRPQEMRLSSGTEPDRVGCKAAGT